MLNSIKTKILLAQLLLVLLMSLLIGLRSHMLLREYLLNVQQDKLISVAHVEAKHLDHLFHDYADQFREIALNDVLEIYAKKFSDQLLQETFLKVPGRFSCLKLC